MCSNPIKIVNPSRLISPYDGQRLYLYVPCGKCFECRTHLQNEWRVRTYFECLDTINTGGYVLFDTLTYKEKYLPRLSDGFDVPNDLDFSCFRLLDISLFLKRLRKRLNKLGYDCKSNLRYFVVSEYGKDVARTHRPHYHIFFFVRYSFCDPITLSKCISDSWSIYNEIDKSYDSIGRTDGIPYKPASYIISHNVFRDLNPNTNRCLLYVSKYVAKDFIYSDLVTRRLNLLMDRKYNGVNWFKDKSAKNYRDMLEKFVCPSHRQSLNYGSYLYRYYGFDKLRSTGEFVFNSSGTPIKMSLFPSMRRKLFYTYSRNYLGEVSFKLNYFGKKFLLNNVENTYRKMLGRFEGYKINVSDNGFNLFDHLFNDDRLYCLRCKTFGDVRNMLKRSFMVDNNNGFYNYCCHYIDFAKKPCFSKVYRGSYKRRFFYDGRLQFDEGRLKLYDFDIFNNIAHINSNNDQKYVEFSQFYKDIGSNKMAVERLKARNKNLLKQIIYV